MRKITLVSTIHEESGLCTVSKLHELLERARPEIIFLEIPPSHFDQFFKENSSSNLESNAANHYLTVRSDLPPTAVPIISLPNSPASMARGCA